MEDYILHGCNLTTWNNMEVDRTLILTYSQLQVVIFEHRVNHLRRYNEATAQRRWWTTMKEPERDQLIQQVRTLKTANVDHLQRAIEYRLYNLPLS
jgi:hypothetical protein